MEGKSPHVMPNPGKCFHASMLGEGGWLEGDSKVLEKERCCARGEVMAHEADGGQVLWIDMGQQRVPAVFGEPEALE